METWPATLPVPNLSGYGLKKAGALIRTEMQTGLARQRKKARGTPTQVKASWRFTPAEMAIFKDWHTNNIFDGAAFFTAALNAGYGMQTYVTRFITDPEENALPGMNWDVSATLEIIDA
jgi:hypothetical protein